MEIVRYLDHWDLATSIDNCEFCNNQVEFPGYIISKDCIGMSEEKVQTREWQDSSN
jgi:hypothetical protein